MSLNELKKLLPAANRYHFFNYAATAPMLKPCADRMIEIIQEGLEPLSMHFEKWMSILESARKTVAEAIHASPEEIAFTTSTSSALSLAARSIAWNPGDRVLYPADDFPSNRYIWECLGVQAEAIPSQDILQTLSNQDLTGVKLVAISAVSYLDGFKHDIPKLVRFCHSKGILVVVDAIQAVGVIPVNMKEWDCDFLACGGQKWLLGPVGSGFLYINKKILSQLIVPLVGWASSRDAGNVDLKKLEFVDGARRFEPGLPDIAAIAGLAKNLEVFAAIGWTKIFEQIENHSAFLRSELSAMGYCIANSDEKAQSGIVTVNLSSQKEAEELHQKCFKEKVILTQRKNQVRISCHATVSKEDIQKLLKILKQQSLKTQSLLKVPHSERKPNDAFKWKNALITGSSQGLGFALAVSLAKRGCNLTLIGRDQEKLNQAAQEIRKNYPIKVTAVALDLSRSEQVEKWLIQQQNAFDFDLIINNAAWAEGGCIADSEIADYRNALETNYFTPLQITQKHLPNMLKNKHGAIINIVTSGARCALPFFTAYASSKAALWSWSEALSRELIGKGVHVMTFIPSHMSTSTNRRLGRKALAYYNMDSQQMHPADLAQVAEKAIESLELKKRYVAPIGVRIKIALNALFHNYMTKRILRFWKT